jgi:hypothetical protein
MSQIDTEDLRFTPTAMEIIRKAESELRTKVYSRIVQKLKAERRTDVTPDDVHYALASALGEMAEVAARFRTRQVIWAVQPRRFRHPMSL